MGSKEMLFNIFYEAGASPGSKSDKQYSKGKLQPDIL
jgi:hypothetical protein